MKVVIAIDSLKGSLTSKQAGEAVREGLLRADPSLETLVIPVADGGEGTLDALIAALDASVITKMVTGPYMEPVQASYAFVESQRLAVIEMAAAAGITLSHHRHPGSATSYGVGEMILDAVHRGAREFLIGIGGSATNDGGLGMLTALGFRFLDAKKNTCGMTGDALETVSCVELEYVPSELFKCRFGIACDVQNPLCGQQGCSAVFGPQKGLQPEDIAAADRAMEHYADVSEDALGRKCRRTPGAGAAGGLGFAFLCALQGELQRGIDLVLDAVDLERYLPDADLVITGEGCLDEQTAFGKTPVGVAIRAKKYGKPVIALAGTVKPGAFTCLEHGIDGYFSILHQPSTLLEAMDAQTAKKTCRGRRNRFSEL